MFSLGRGYVRLSWPFAVFFLLANPKIHPAYRMTWRRKIRLGYRMYRNGRRIQTGTSYKAHLAMASKLLEIPPSVRGVVVECGCWLGGSTANLSLVCDVVGRDLIVYDSFEGLPAAAPGDRMARDVTGSFRGDLETVREHVRRFGALERCEFRKGWFADTLRHHTEPIVLCFTDVDLMSSMHDCVVHLWPHLVENGFWFTDDYVRLDRCALFYSERFWREQLGCAPPGLMGAGTGVGVGQYFLGPWPFNPPVQQATSVAYTRKSFRASWDYVPEADP